jgi:hypothetical protein
VVPPTPSLVLKSRPLGIDDARIAVMGHNGETFGLMVFFSREDQATFESNGGPPMRDHVTIPRCLSVNVRPMPTPSGADPDPPMIALVRVLEQETQRAPTDEEMTLAVAASRRTARSMTARARCGRCRRRTTRSSG